MGTVPPILQQAQYVSGYVDMLVTKLSNEEDHSNLEEAARQLAVLSQSDADKCVIARRPGALDSLAKLLFVDVSKNIQEFAVKALGNLATSPENRHLIAATSGVLDGLIQSLQSSVNNNVQLQALRALVNLSKETQNQLIIVEVPDALTYIVELLRRNEGPATQRQAALILTNLALPVQNKDMIANCPGAIDGLMRLLDEHNPPLVQMFGARALLHLVAQNANGQAMLAVAGCPGVPRTPAYYTRVAYPGGVLGGLVNLLGKPQEALHFLAARTLVILMSEKQNLERVAFFPGFLDGMLGLHNRSPSVQEAATCALAYLSKALACACIPIEGDLHSMQKLVQLMVNMSDNPHVNSMAAEIMKNLTMLPVNIDFIVACPGALQVIEGQFGNHLSPNTRRLAVNSIANIAASCMVPGTLDQMVPRILPTLVELLHKDDAPYAQLHVLRAFQYLARSFPSKLQIRQHPSFIDGIKRCICSPASKAIQTKAAIAWEVVFT